MSRSLKVSDLGFEAVMNSGTKGKGHLTTYGF